MNKSILNKSALTSLVLFFLIFIVGCNTTSGESTPTVPAGTATLRRSYCVDGRIGVRASLTLLKAAPPDDDQR